MREREEGREAGQRVLCGHAGWTARGQVPIRRSGADGWRQGQAAPPQAGASAESARSGAMAACRRLRGGGCGCTTRRGCASPWDSACSGLCTQPRTAPRCLPQPRRSDRRAAATRADTSGRASGAGDRAPRGTRSHQGRRAAAAVGRLAAAARPPPAAHPATHALRRRVGRPRGTAQISR